MQGRGLYERAEALSKRYEELNALLYAPEIIADGLLWRKYALEQASVSEAAQGFAELLAKDAEIARLKTELSGAVEELKALILEELSQAEQARRGVLLKLSRELKQGMSQDRIAIELIASPKGGMLCKAMLWGYKRFVSEEGFELLNLRETKDKVGGLARGRLDIAGEGAFDEFAKERGFHKLAGEQEQSVLVVIYADGGSGEPSFEEKDVKLELFRSDGAGGQNVNKVESAVRARHLPTGIVAVCRDERSQLQNKEKALETLKARVSEHYEKKALGRSGEARRSAAEHSRERGVVRIYDAADGERKDGAALGYRDIAKFLS